MNNKYIFSVREELSILATHNNPLYNYFDNDSSILCKFESDGGSPAAGPS